MNIRAWPCLLVLVGFLSLSVLISACNSTEGEEASTGSFGSNGSASSRLTESGSATDAEPATRPAASIYALKQSVEENAVAGPVPGFDFEETALDLGLDTSNLTREDKQMIYEARLEQIGVLDGEKKFVDIPLIAAQTDNYLLFDTYVASAAPDTNYGTDPQMFVGYNSGWTDVLLSNVVCPSGTVTEAELWVYILGNTQAGYPFYVSRIAGTWSETAVTWNTDPYNDGYSDGTYAISGTGYDWYTADQAVTRICGGGQTNYGIYFETLTSTSGYLELSTYENANDYYSYLRIYYNTTTTTTTTATTTTTVVTTTTTPTTTTTTLPTTTTTTTHTTTTTTLPTTTTTTTPTTTTTNPSSTTTTVTTSTTSTTQGTTPNPPTDLTATTVSQTQIHLAWTDQSSDEGGFAIDRKIGLFGSWAYLVAVGQDVTSYEDESLTCGTRYFYRVRSCIPPSNCSAYSNVADDTTFACDTTTTTTTIPADDDTSDDTAADDTADDDSADDSADDATDDAADDTGDDSGDDSADDTSDDSGADDASDDTQDDDGWDSDDSAPVSGGDDDDDSGGCGC